MTRSSRSRSGSLLLRFTVVSLLLTIGVGLVLASLLRSVVVDRAQEQAERAAVVAVRLGLQPQLSAEDLAEGFPPERLAAVESALRTAGEDEASGGGGLGGMDPVHLKIFDRTGRIVYADERVLVGRQVDSANLRAALGGQVVSALTTPEVQAAEGDPDRRQLLEVYVPVQYPGSDEPDGVMEVYVPYAPVAAGIRADVRALSLALVGSLAVFWLALHRLIAGASRRLHRQTKALQAHAARNEHQAMHDALTGLPNRVLLLDRTERALAAAVRSGAQVAVLLVDLDRFKEVNDTLGHSYGDELLRQVSGRLAAVLRDGDTLARLGGDEFAVLLPDVAQMDEVARVAERLRTALHTSFDVEGVAIDVEASVGVAVAPHHGEVTEDLVRHADIAMYAAKELKSGAVVFDPAAHATVPSRLTMLGDLRRALDVEGELFLHYQPKIALDGERLDGVEALLRWAHPEKGMVPPAEFIPVAEGTGLIMQLTDRVLDDALAQVRAWLDEGHRVPVAVNLSTRCLLDARLPERVQRSLARHAVPSSLLRLEITESAVIDDAARAIDVLARLSALGVRLSVDDFGTGYTSMAHLRRLPVDELKIDRSFILGMTATEQDAVLVRTAVDLGHNLGLTVVAEGVEGPEHVVALRALGCDVAQGYHFARPMPAEQFTALLRAEVTATA